MTDPKEPTQLPRAQGDNAPLPLRVHVFLPGGIERSRDFTGRFVVGRDAACDVRLQDQQVSRRHAEFASDGASWHVRDLGSGNGTFVDGARITQTVLPPTAEVRFGEDGPRIRIGSRDHPAEVPPAAQAPTDSADGPATVITGTVRERASTAPLRITWTDSAGHKQTREFNSPLQIGRDPSCDIQIDDERVSRTHVQLYPEDAHWCLRDLDSANGSLIDGVHVRQSVLASRSALHLGADGPRVLLETEAATAQAAGVSLEGALDHYFGDDPQNEGGDRTQMIRQAFRQVRRKQRRKYGGVIAAVVALLVLALAYGGYQHKELQKSRGLALDVFYNMKNLELQLVRIESILRESGDAAQLAELDAGRTRLHEMSDQYDAFLQELGVSDKKLSPEDRLIFRMARLFGECELDMPDEFLSEVKRYIAIWQSNDRLPRAIAKARQHNLPAIVYKAMLEKHMPPQFLYVALQESEFNPRAVGPETRFGIAKGMWQFMPATGVQYGLRTGPLIELRRYDPADQRFDAYSASLAAAHFLSDLYATDAQASGLLVMASYNWGPTNVRRRIREMPENPRERNFWRLIEEYEIPSETRNYVFLIFSAAVIGEDPALFGFDFENPFQELDAILGTDGA